MTTSRMRLIVAITLNTNDVKAPMPHERIGIAVIAGLDLPCVEACA